MLRALPLLLASALALNDLGLSAAWAQSVTYLSPDRWRAELGAPVTTEPKALDRSWAPIAQAPLKGEATRRAARSAAKSWRERETTVLFIRGAGTQANYDAVPEVPADEASDSQRPGNALPVRQLRFQPEGADSWMIGADWAPRIEELSPSAVSAFLKFHSEAWPEGLRPKKQAVRVARYESSKALLVVPDASGRSGSSGTAMSKTAQRAQLRPLNDPCMTVPGTSLILRLYLPEGVPLRHMGTATQLDSGEFVPFPFNADGFGSVVIPSAGPWLVEVHAAVAPTKERELRTTGAHLPDLVIHTVTLAFEAPPAPPEEKQAASKGER